MKILYHARIHTLNPAQPAADALAISHGRIVAAGPEATLRAEFEGRARFEDLGGRTVLPGLTDAHIHLEHFAFSLQKVNCETPSRAECLRRVAEAARNTLPGGWVLGHGWTQNDWPEGFGDAALLDTVTPGHPAYLTAKSLHAAWANSAALREAGLTAHTPDPPNGKIQRDASGAPTGILFESAMELVSQALPAPTQEQSIQAIRTAQPVLWGMGLTGAHDFDRRRCFVSLQALRASDELRLRVIKSIPVEDLPFAVGAGLQSGFGDDFLRIGHVKIFADGALGPNTAAMFQPFAGAPDNRGMLFMDAEEIFEHGRNAAENGLGLVIHAIGDRANHEVLDAYAQLREFENAHGLPHRRHRIEHVQLLHPEDFPRLAALGVIASMQPIHATSDMLAADRFWGARAAYAYAWRSLADLGTPLAFGSDAPVDSPNPFWGLHAASTRRRLDGSPGPEGWYPAQRLTRLEALQGYTTGAAFAANLEDRLGMLAPGFFADLIVLETDPLTCPPEILPTLAPQAVMVGGEWVL